MKKTKSYRNTMLLLSLFGVMLSNAQAGSVQYPDALLTTPGTPEVVQKGLEADGYSLGIMAYTWGYPLIRMERVMREYVDVPSPKPATSYRAPLNQIGWARALATPAAKDMPTANNDTAYMSSVVKLDEPYILFVPDTADRYYVVNIFNMWQEIEHYIGRRTTGTKAGKYIIVPPGWEGKLLTDATRLDVKTDKVWLWGRMRIAQGEALEPIHKLQDQFTLTPLSGSSVKGTKLDAMPAIGDDPLGFFTHLSFALQANQVTGADEALFAQFTRIGLTEEGFDPSKISEDTKQGLLKGLADGPAVATASFASTASKREGWDWVTGMDSFGFNYPLRAMIAGPYLGGNGELEAMYPIRYTDSKGAPLTGANEYVIRFKKAPPVGAFWSLTMYNADDKMLVKNEIERYKVGTDTEGLHILENGSFELPIQHSRPEGEFAANWLPAPQGNFYVILRMYQPNDAILSGEYVLPQLEQVK
ncbi:MAG: DUF1214 domain-containing protein [Thermodesulfobacteriota bacterium]|nr:DUF1214 domain-containing protein [Thermodesulfobacteriota bacterium]